MPPEYLASILAEDKSLPEPDAVLGLDEGGDETTKAPSVKELLQDPDVKAIVEATEGLVPAS